MEPIRRTDEDILTEISALLDSLGERDTGLGSALPARAVALAGLIDRAQATLAVDLAVMTAHGMVPASYCNAAVWLSMRTHTTRSNNAGLLALGRRLMDTDERALPSIATALDTGAVTTDQARTIARVTRDLPQEIIADTESALLCAATRTGEHALAPELLEKAGRRLRTTLAPHQAAARAEYVRGGCYLRTTRGYDGTHWIEGNLSPVCAQMLTTLLTPLAARRPATTTPRDLRTPGQRTHDALEELLTKALKTKKNHYGGRRPGLVIHADLTDLLNAANAQTRSMSQPDSGRGRTESTGTPPAPATRLLEVPAPAAPRPEPVLPGFPLLGSLPDGTTIDPATTARICCDPEVSWIVTTPEHAHPPGRHKASPDQPWRDPDQHDQHPPPTGPDPNLIATLLHSIAPALGGIPLAVLAIGHLPTTRHPRPTHRLRTNATAAASSPAATPAPTAPKHTT